MTYFIAILPIIIALAVVLWWTTQKKSYVWWRPVLGFTLGLFVAVLSYFTQSYVHGIVDPGFSWYWILIEAFLITALIEEGVKFLTGIIGVKLLETLSTLEVILFFLCIGLGFAALENVLYAYNHTETTMIARAFTAVPSHLIYGILMGALYAKSLQTKKWTSYSIALVIPIFMHGLYNYFIIQPYADWIMLCAPALLIATAIFCYNIILWNKG